MFILVLLGSALQILESSNIYFKIRVLQKGEDVYYVLQDTEFHCKHLVCKLQATWFLSSVRLQWGADCPTIAMYCFPCL